MLRVQWKYKGTIKRERKTCRFKPFNKRKKYIGSSSTYYSYFSCDIESVEVAAPLTLRIKFTNGREVLYHVLESSQKLIDHMKIVPECILEHRQRLRDDPDFFNSFTFDYTGINWKDNLGLDIFCLYYDGTVVVPFKKTLNK